MLTTPGFRTASRYNTGRLRAAGIDARRDSSAASPIRSAGESENDSVRRPSEAPSDRAAEPTADVGSAARGAEPARGADVPPATGANTNATPNASGIGRFTNNGGG